MAPSLYIRGEHSSGRIWGGSKLAQLGGRCLVGGFLPQLAQLLGFVSASNCGPANAVFPGQVDNLINRFWGIGPPGTTPGLIGIYTP